MPFNPQQKRSSLLTAEARSSGHSNASSSPTHSTHDLKVSIHLHTLPSAVEGQRPPSGGGEGYHSAFSPFIHQKLTFLFFRLIPLSIGTRPAIA